MAQPAKSRKPDEEQINWGIFLTLFVLTTLAFLVWLAFNWKGS